jgi:hypothetical protein
MTESAVMPELERDTSREQSREEKEAAGSSQPTSSASPVERLLWTPTGGEDATKILFPLSRSKE